MTWQKLLRTWVEVGWSVFMAPIRKIHFFLGWGNISKMTKLSDLRGGWMNGWYYSYCTIEECRSGWLVDHMSVFKQSLVCFCFCYFRTLFTKFALLLINHLIIARWRPKSYYLPDLKKITKKKKNKTNAKSVLLKHFRNYLWNLLQSTYGTVLKY